MYPLHGWSLEILKGGRGGGGEEVGVERKNDAKLDCLEVCVLVGGWGAAGGGGGEGKEALLCYFVSWLY